MKNTLITGILLLVGASAMAGANDWSNEELHRGDGYRQAVNCENRGYADRHTRRHNRYHNDAACVVRDFHGRIWRGYADNAQEACGEAVASCSRDSFNWPCNVVACYR